MKRMRANFGSERQQKMLCDYFPQKAIYEGGTLRNFLNSSFVFGEKITQ